MKYLIWGPGRTGSVWYSRCLCSALGLSFDEITHTLEGTAVGDTTITHAHNPIILKDSNTQQIIARRNIFATAISHLIAKHTDVWSIGNKQQAFEYSTRWGDLQLEISTRDMIAAIGDIHASHKVAELYTRSDAIILDYEVYCGDVAKFLTVLNIPQCRHIITTNLKNPINKYHMIKNLHECWRIYTTCKSIYRDMCDTYDAVTLQEITRIIGEQ